ERGLVAHREAKLDEMAALFDEVLAESPGFARASEMVAGYAAYARSHLDDARPKAEQALGRAARLSGADSSAGKAAERLLLTLRAEDVVARPVADQTLVRQAMDLDPSNARARTLLDRMSRGEADPEAKTRRYTAAGVIAALALAALAFIGLR